MNFYNQINELCSIKETIKNSNMFLQKKLGQNFIYDLNITNKIAQESKCKKKNVIEIGPGVGSLTRSLFLNGAKHIFAIEKDINSINALSELQSIAKTKLNLIHDDAKNIKLHSLYSSPFTVVGNLPYNIATFLIISWIKEINYYQSTNNLLLERIVILVQEEVAKKISARVGEKLYGRLSVLINLFCDCEIKINLKPNCFFPVPKVNSSLIEIIPLNKMRYKVNLDLFEKITKVSFSQRRKMLRQSLKNIQGERIIKSSKIDGTLRPENLTTKNFCDLANSLSEI